MTTVSPPMCFYCGHYRGSLDWGQFACAAFPERIPSAIYEDYEDHRLPFEGDGGIRFKPKDQRAGAIVARQYGPAEDVPSRAAV